MFDKLLWQDDKMQLNDLTFRLEQTKNNNWNEGNDHFIFYKLKTLVDQYEAFFRSFPDSTKPTNMMEIGMWDGGSAAFWNELLNPKKLVGVDLLANGGNEYFQKYLKKVNEKNQKIIPYWNTDQADAVRLRQIIVENFKGEPIDIVFDDASHMYEPSLASFNAVFPYMSHGGIYIIEDWAWAHWKGFDSMFPPNSEPTKLIFELTQAAANTGLIENIITYQGFVVVKRGNEPIPEPKESFKLSNYIFNNSKQTNYYNYLKGNSFKSKLKTILEIIRK
jgi:hypothetical protein